MMKQQVGGIFTCYSLFIDYQSYLGH